MMKWILVKVYMVAPEKALLSRTIQSVIITFTPANDKTATRLRQSNQQSKTNNKRHALFP
jgi:hypothetical protein